MSYIPLFQMYAAGWCSTACFLNIHAGNYWVASMMASLVVLNVVLALAKV